MSILEELVHILAISDDISSKPFSYESESLSSCTDILKKNNIKYRISDSLCIIDLSSQSMRIFKTKKDYAEYFKSEFEKEIVIIIEDELIYSELDDINYFFENIIFGNKIKELFIKFELMDFHNELEEEFLFLYQDSVKIHISYNKYARELFNADFSFKDIVKNLSEKFKDKSYREFFKLNFIQESRNSVKSNTKFFKILMDIQKISEITDIDYDLFMRKFSYKEFRSDLDEEKEKFFEAIQENVSNFLNKVNVLPVQFGIYFLLLFKFYNDVLPLIATIIVIITWSTFNLLSVYSLKKSTDDLKLFYNEKFLKISEKSNMDISKDSKDIETKITNMTKLICAYIYTIIIFSVLAVFFAGYAISSDKEQADIKKQQEIILYIPYAT